jgi:hypothetical protein
VGGSGWTVSLTQIELDDFVLALRTIHSTMRDLLVQQGGSSAEPLKVKVSVGVTSNHMINV